MAIPPRSPNSNHQMATTGANYWDGDSPSDYMRKGKQIYISVPGNNSLQTTIQSLISADPGVITVDGGIGNLFSFDFSNTKAVGTWRWLP